MLFTAATLLLLGQTMASPLQVRACPNIHVFGARETTAPPGYGSSDTVVNLVKQAYPGATSEAISYPACGGQASCGGVSYSQSVQAGIQAVASAVNSFNRQCPDTEIVLVGYSQGGEIMDVNVCGGGDPNQGYRNTAVPLSSSAIQMVKAAILMGDPLFHWGLPYEVGTCRAGGFDARPSGFQCAHGDKIQSYCDAADPYCCNGNNAQTHQGYGSEYGQDALAFIKSKLGNSSGGGSGGGGNDGSGNTGGGGDGNTGSCAAKWGQCGGRGFNGPTCCQSGSTCHQQNQWYSQCL